MANVLSVTVPFQPLFARPLPFNLRVEAEFCFPIIRVCVDGDIFENDNAIVDGKHFIDFVFGAKPSFSNLFGLVCTGTKPLSGYNIIFLSLALSLIFLHFKALICS